MSEARSGRGFAPGFLLLGSAFFLLSPGLDAQPAPDSAIAVIREELDHLTPLLRRLGDRANSAEYLERMRKLREEQPLVDTFPVGPFRVVSLPAQKELAEEVIRAAWDELRPLIDGSEDLLEPWSFQVHYHWPREVMPHSGDSLLRRVSMSRRYPLSYLRKKATEIVGNTLIRGGPPALEAWSGGQPRVAPQRLPWVARELVATPSRAVRGCFRGDHESCVESLALRGTEGGWERWYTAEERRHHIQGRTRPSGERESAIWEGCVHGGMDDACEVLLRGAEPLIPLSPEARASFLGHALWMGGAGAYQRLRAAEGEPLLDRLVAAAGVPRDSLLASWRSEVLGARPSAWAGLVRSPLALLFWVVLFGALAVRSTRWRLG